jgi:hypothetical protein
MNASFRLKNFRHLILIDKKKALKLDEMSKIALKKPKSRRKTQNLFLKGRIRPERIQKVKICVKKQIKLPKKGIKKGEK